MEQITNDIHQRRLETELASLDKLPDTIQAEVVPSPFGRVVKIVLPSNSAAADVPIEFELHLEGKFPFQSPKLLAVSPFTAPSVADGRDLLLEILGGQWNPQIPIKSIIQSLPEFAVTLQKEVNTNANYSIGTHHLGHPMLLSFWEGKERTASYNCVELDPGNDAFRKDRTIVITPLVLIELERTPKFTNFGHLICWATLTSLANIKRSKSEPNRLILTWKNTETSPGFSQVFDMPGVDSCVDLITENLQALNVGVRRLANLPTPTIAEEEVSAQSLEKVNIDNILGQIKEKEALLEGPLTVELITGLMMLYQQAIEYYSALNDPKFDLLLNRMHEMLQDERIATALRDG